MRVPITFSALLFSVVLIASPAVAQDKRAAISPKKVVNLLADPEFKDFTVNLNPKGSLTFKREEIWKIMEDELLHISGKGSAIFGPIRNTKTTISFLNTNGASEPGLAERIALVIVVYWFTVTGKTGPTDCPGLTPSNPS